jgi:type I restriction enzyme S subunit
MTAPLQYAANQGDDLPQGYKRTEVGVIPVDWEVKRLGEVAHIKTGKKNNDDKVEDGQYDFFVRSQTVEKIDTYSYDGEAILIPGEGGIGSIFHYINGRFDYHQRVYKISDFESHVSGRFVYFYMLQNFHLHATKNSVKATVDSLRLPTFKDFELPLPPLPEQTAIATVLSDVDGLIASLTALIAKKRAVKHATMQQLLTGKTRLAGFTGAWEVKRLGDVFHITAGGDFDPTTSSDFWDETHLYPVYSNALTNKGLYSYCSYNNHNPDTITVTARGTLGHCEYRNHAYTAIGRLLVLEKLADVSCVYVAEYINKNIIFTIESTGVPQLTAPQISQYQIPLPPLPEQTAIAAILTDMDTEITTLETRLAKTKALKTGMCQELLTGKTRLL